MNDGWNIRGILKFVVHALAMVAIAWFLVWGFGKSVEVVGQSMEPTLEPGQRVILDRVSYKFEDPQRYDVIAYTVEELNAGNIDDLKADEPAPVLTIKRIIGLPGEQVLIADGTIYIDGEPLTGHGDLSKSSLAGIASEPIQLDDNEYFVLGDNRKASEDSRYEKIGNIGKNRILGKVWYRTLPFKQAGKIE